jgi:hypothetical protein
MPGRELISRRTKIAFREALSDWCKLRTIGIAFENEGFAPDLSYEPDVGGQRRSLVEQYYKTIDFSNSNHVFRLLRAFEELMLDIEKNTGSDTDKLKMCLEHDGYKFENGRLLLKNPNM